MNEKTAIVRKKLGKSFHYFQDNKQIKDKSELDYLKSLRVPPAWGHVKIAANKKARILATGYDKAGRLQYIYHPSFRAKQEEEKFQRTLRFAQALPRLRRITARHLKHKKLDKEKVMACIVMLMDQAYFRVGNDVYANENQSYGLTTLRSKHLRVQGDTITFDFVGKSNQKHVKHITDRTLARIVKRLDDLPGYEVFKYYDDKWQLKDVKSSGVNAYIKELMGEEFTAKDFRTWGGTLLATAELAALDTALPEKERKKALTVCVKKVAKKLGNTPAIAKNSYIDPRLINAFIAKQDLGRIKQMVQKMKRNSYLSPDEQCVLKILNPIN